MPPQCQNELHGVLERCTNSIATQVSDILWSSLQSAPLCLSSKSGKADRKIVDRRSGDTSYREIWLAENEKQDKIFCNNVSHTILGLLIESCGLSHSQTGKKCVVSHERKVKWQDLPTALLSSRDSWKKTREKYMWIRFLVWMTGSFTYPQVWQALPW